MSSVISHFFVTLVRDACHRAFWRKKVFVDFLIYEGVPREKAVPVLSSRDSKAYFLNALFSDMLTNDPTLANTVILNIARALVKMTFFHDLSTAPEESELKIEEAEAAIARLRPELEKVEQALRAESQASAKREEASKIREKNILSQATLEKFKDRLFALYSGIGTQKAGYEFETWLFDFFAYAKLESRGPYRDPSGRQVDGALTLDGTHYLVEAKFTKNPTESPDIDIFLGKLKNKADNTMGIFISISGFTEGAKQDASEGRTLLLLIDGLHLFSLVFTGQITINDLIRKIRRHASETGLSYMDTGKFFGT